MSTTYRLQPVASEDNALREMQAFSNIIILTENPTITINTDVMIKIHINFLTFAR